MKANLPKREPEMLKHWDELKLYERMLEVRKDAPIWILHDGPPYANGRVHMGTALNKILKDFVVRSRSVLGFRTPFVPGWDCHGMPIEFKVSRDLGAKARTISKVELRRLCKEEADKWIDIQRSDFRRLGAIGDWFDPYLTMKPEYDAAEVSVLRKMVELGYVYRGLRPVHWCFSDRTALAEAEVEYGDHVSPSIYVAFPFNTNLTDAASLAANKSEGDALAAAHNAGKLFGVIWTTTPWTLPANLGISLNPTFEYVGLKVGDNYYVVADKLAESVVKECNLNLDGRIDLDREALRALDGKDVFRHPFIARDVKLMYGDHVTAEAGTGLVHTAPGHGYEDFVIGARYGLEPYTPVDSSGLFTADAGEWAGQNVFKANDSIVEHLRKVGALLHTHKYSHSYPHCWRCKNPLIFRAAEQWFLNIDHENLRGRIVDAIDGVNWVPSWSRDRIRNMTETRPDWCLSRQRAWGVPIPALRCTSCREVVLDLATMERTEEIFRREGSDAWFVRPAADFAAPGLKCAKCGGANFEKEEDVLDVWFDSGSSQNAVLAERGELAWPADAYLEAVEQARGWFGSSLVCAVAERSGAPFRNVISHGLTVDEKGRKMSKSLGNSPDAADVVNRIGADVLRLVYASLDYTTEIALGDTIYNSVSESYRKIRNTARYILGNIADFDPDRDTVEHAAMLEFDRYILARLEKVKDDVRKAYEGFDFQAAYQAMQTFIVIDLSSLYIDVARDRLYCSGEKSRERRSAQTALFIILDTLLRMLAPIIPYTADEVYSYLPGKRLESVHLLTMNPAHPEWRNAELEDEWEKLLNVREWGMRLLEQMRQAGTIGAPLDAELYVGDDGHSKGLSELLAKHQSDLKDLFIVSSLQIFTREDVERLRQTSQIDVERRLVPGTPKEVELDGMLARSVGVYAFAGRHAPGNKCQRCWRYFEGSEGQELDSRCQAVVESLSDGR